MIQMPHRSVTRFFIPLIDVLLLTFGIFLLMPFASDAEAERHREASEERSQSTEQLSFELQRRVRELAKFDKLRGELSELERLKAEVERLREASKQAVQQRTLVHILDIDPKSGDLLYYEPTRLSDPPLKLARESDAKTLIEQHAAEARGKEVYYVFLYPRPETGFPTFQQEQRIKAWFAKTAHSLKEAK